MAHIATMGTGEASRAFASVIAKALRQVGDGRVTAANARLLRRAIAATTIEHRFGVAIEPERSLGAFEAFPQAAREAIIHAIKDQDRWRFALSRGQRALRARLGQGRWGSSATRLLLGQWQAAHWGRLLRQGQFAARPTLAAMLALARLQPKYFAVCYAQEVPQPAAFRGFWHDPARQMTVGVMVPGRPDTITGNNSTRRDKAQMRILAGKLRACIDKVQVTIVLSLTSLLLEWYSTLLLGFLADA